MVNSKDEEAEGLKDRVEALTEEMKSMQADIDNNLQEGLLRDLEEWVTRSKTEK